MNALLTYISTHKRLLLITCLSICFFVFYAHLVHADPTAAQNAAQAAKDEGGFFDSIGDTIGQIMYDIALAIGGYLFTGIGGFLFDTAIDQTILQAGLWFSPGTGWGLGEAIAQLWTVIRDMLNILFIFSFIYIGIKTILDSHSSETRRSLGFLILAALLINFSLFFTQIIVDFSNIAAIQIHNQIKTGLVGGASAGSLSFDSGSIAGGFMNVTSLSSFFGGTDTILEKMTFQNQIVYSLLMMVFLIIAGVVFAMGAFLLIRRFITLTLCMIFSPIMFAGWILPQFSETQEQWRGKLLMNAFFAPALLFMIYLSLHILDVLKKNIIGTQTTSFAGAAQDGAGAVGVMSLVFFFALAIGFLYASIQVGQRMSIAGADSALKITKRALSGATAGMARNTAGRLAYNFSESNTVKDIASRKGLLGYTTRAALKGSRIAADSDMEFMSGGFGAGKKGGYKSTRDAVLKKEEEFAKSLGEVGDDDTVVKELKHKEHHLHDQLEIDQEAKKDAIKNYNKVKNDASATAEQKKQAEEQKDAAVKKVEDTKKAIKEAGEAIAHEKNRRIVGSVATRDAIKRGNEDIEKARAKHNELAMQLIEAQRSGDNALKESLVASMNLENQRIKESTAQVRRLRQQAGYAAVLETSSMWVPSWITGHMQNQDKDAGVAIRKKYAKESIKQDAGGHGGGHDGHGGHGDDHGGGHDAHGGGHDAHGGGHGGGGHGGGHH